MIKNFEKVVEPCASHYWLSDRGFGGCRGEIQVIHQDQDHYYYHWLFILFICYSFDFLRFLFYQNTALFSSFCLLSVRFPSQGLHPTFSLVYDGFDQTDHTFSESISLVLFPRSLCMALCLSLNVSERMQKSSEVSFCHFLPRLAPSRPLFQKIDASKLKPSRRTCHLEHYPFPRGHLFIFWMMVFYVPLLWICAI